MNTLEAVRFHDWDARPRALGFGLNGELVTLTDSWTGSRPARARLAKTRNLEVAVHAWGTRWVANISTDLIVDFVQLLNDEILLVCSRARSYGPEQNAEVFDYAGTLKRRFTLGDGIEQVCVGPSGDLWVSYFDEGVLGNWGWGGGLRPMGADGVVCYSASGEKKWGYNDHNTLDVYALNVTESGDVWFCPYTEFPLVRVRGKHTRVWGNTIRGSHAFAVKTERLLFAGDYNNRHLFFEVGASERMSAAPLVATFQAQYEGELLSDFQAVGVGQQMYLVTDAGILTLEW